MIRPALHIPRPALALLAGLLVTVSAAPAAAAQSTSSQPIFVGRSASGTTTIRGSRSLNLTPAQLTALKNGGSFSTLEVEPMPAGPGAATGGSEGAEPQEEPLDPMFLQQFQQVVLDRRPSTILAEWAKPEPLPADEDPELQDPEEPTAVGEAPTAPTPPAKPEEIGEANTPEEVEGPVTGLADLVALAEAKAKAAEYAAAMEAFEPLQEAYEAAKEDFEARTKAYAEAKAKYDAKVAELKMKRIQREIELFRRNVTLGRWDRVEETLDRFPEDQAKMQYQQLLMKVAQSPQQMGGQLAQYQEQPAFEFDDVIALISIAPGGFEKEKASMVAPLVRRVFDQGHALNDWTDRLRAEIARPEEERVVRRRLAALLLTAQGYNEQLGEFLPTMEKLVEENDREGLNLLARHHLAMNRKDGSPETLGAAWDATLAVLAPGKVPDKQKNEALKRAVDLAGRVREAKGDDWLRETFAERPERGMEVLAVIGAEASKGMTQSAYNPEPRKENLKLLHSSISKLVEIAPERAAEWRDTLVLVADTWLREAEHSFQYSQQTSMGPSYQRDAFGNIYWTGNSYSYNRVPVRPIEPSDLLEYRPDGVWRGALPESLRPKIDQTIAQLYLKVQEEKLAFPYIKDLAPSEPEKANDLARTFIEVWLNNNDPNADRNRTSIYNFSFGFNQRASGIPLTRSRQERNLRELSKWVAKLREIEGIELDSNLLVRAFRQCHSAAEVYRVDAMEEVFGELETLEPDTLAAMSQTMRANLGNLWRDPSVQKDAGTNRKQKEIEAEVQRGYTVAQEMLGRAIDAHPDSWQLMVARGAMMHDLNNYRNEIQKSSDFSGDRRAALDVLRGAALKYVESIPDLRVNEYRVDAFSTWFYAALGASDLGAVSERTLLANGEIGAIRSVLDSIEGEAGEKHRAMFANLIFTRLSNVNPAVKNRYLEAGFEIAGDHPQAREAKRVYEYYQDLVTEIQLVTSVDGSGDVGTEPFGVKVDLLYTKEIGRESGGFGKYLQNQANAVNAYYNYGRPQENYRDKFEESARTLLDEQFEVLSVTFNREDAATKVDAGPIESELGPGTDWRRTSYAYILMRAKSPAVDRIPPLKMDLDFNDVTGYVVLPVTSPVVPIDASSEPEPRPYADLEITQVLDERLSDQGVLKVEVKARADGLVPELEQVVDFDDENFEIASVTGGDEISVEAFAQSEDAIVSQRLWEVELRPKEGAGRPETFAFAVPVDDGVDSQFQRYDDADLVSASAVVDLRQVYDGGSKFAWWWWLVILAGLGAVVAVAVVLARGTDAEDEAKGEIRIPDELTPVTVLGLLGDLRRNNGIDSSGLRDLDAAALQIEEHYFRAGGGGEPDLDAIVRRFVGRARPAGS